MYIASTNAGKIKEISAAFADSGIELISLDVDFDELEDALKQEGITDMETISKAKARAALSVIENKKLEKLPVIVDDAGIYFEKLGNEPGIETKTFVKKHGGIEGVKKVIEEGDRAYFQSVVTYMDHVLAEPVSFVGRLYGKLSAKDTATDNEKGFPFNHLFIPDGADDFLYKIPLEQRKNFSHRFLAAGQLKNYGLSEIKRETEMTCEQEINKKNRV